MPSWQPITPGFPQYAWLPLHPPPRPRFSSVFPICMGATQSPRRRPGSLRLSVSPRRHGRGAKDTAAPQHTPTSLGTTQSIVLVVSSCRAPSSRPRAAMVRVTEQQACNCGNAEFSLEKGELRSLRIKRAGRRRDEFCGQPC